MLSLTEFLLARIAEDERGARHHTSAGFDYGEPAERAALMAAQDRARPDPARVLAECEAKRRIVEHCDATPTCGGYMPPGRERDEFDARLGFTPARHLPEEYAPGCDGCSAAESVAMSDSWILKHLAAIYADHPDYRDEWRP